MTSPRDTEQLNDHLVVDGVIGGDPGQAADLDTAHLDTPARGLPAPDYDRDPPTSPIPAQRTAEAKKGFFSRLFNRG